MMSLRSLTAIGSLAVAATALGGCADKTSGPLAPIRAPAAAQFDGKPGDTGNAAKSGAISVQAMVDVSGQATLTFRTGTFNPITGAELFDGYFKSIQYKIYDLTGKQVLVQNVQIKGSGTNKYSTTVNLCSKDDDGPPPPCASKVGLNWSASVQAEIRGVAGDDNETDVVRSTAVFLPPPNTPVDVALQPVQRIGNGVNTSTVIALDTAKAGTSITVRATVQNPAALNTAVDCSIIADPTLQATPVGSSTKLIVPAGGSAACQYTLKASALGSFPITISATPSAGSPTDPNAGNNSSSGTLKVVSGGQFSSVNISSIDLQQQWFNLVGDAAFPAESLTLQNVRVSDVGLLVVPTQDVIGTFTLKGTVVTPTMTFPSGVVSGTLYRSTSGVYCSNDLTAGPNAPFSGAPAGFPTQFGFSANICSEPATVNGVPGFQHISVSYVQSLNASMMNPGPYLLTGTVQLKVELTYTLTGSSSTDKVSATINITVPSPTLRSVTNLDGTRVLWTEQNPAPATVTSP